MKTKRPRSYLISKNLSWISKKYLPKKVTLYSFSFYCLATKSLRLQLIMKSDYTYALGLQIFKLDFQERARNI